jgi:hypothetical protein
VRKFATPQIEEMKPKADAIALADTKATVLEAFGKHSDELVSDLNSRLPWKQTVALLMPQDTQWSGHFASTKDWILASPGPKDAGIPELPEEEAKVQAPIELWLHGKPGDGTAAKVIAIWKTPGYPDYHWIAQPNLDQRFGKGFTTKVQQAIVSWRPSDPEQKQILGLFGAQQFTDANAAAYGQIEQVGRQIGKIR